MVDDLNRTNEIKVLIDSSLSESEAKSIETELRTIDNVWDATFKSKEEALKDFIEEHNGDPAFSGVEAEDLRHRVVVVLEDNALLEQTIEQIRKVNGVADVVAHY